MKTVCLITTGHKPFDRRVFHKEAKSLVNFGYDVKLVAHAAKDTTRDGVDIISIGNKTSRSDRIRHLRPAYLSAKETGAEVYHFHDPELLPVGALLSHRTDANVVFDAHEDYGQNAVYRRPWIPDFVKKLARQCYPAGQQRFAQQLDAVITTTEAIAHGFRKRNYPEVTLIRNFPITEHIEIDSPPHERDHEYILTYVGGLEESRGLMKMMEILKHLRNSGVDIGLWLIGPFRTNASENRRKVREFLDIFDLSNNVKMFGYIPHENIFSYLQAADIGLSLVNRKGFEYILPTKIFEYMYTELPVVATDTGPLRDYVNEEYGMLVQEDPKDIAESILQWLAEDKLSEMGKAGKKKVLTEYNWEKEAEKLNRLYSDLTK